MIYYLAGPMTGLPHYNFEYFWIAEKKLKKAGYDIVSPAKVSECLWRKLGWIPSDRAITMEDVDEFSDILPRCEYIRADDKAQSECDAIILLHGWERSEGARREVDNAKAWGQDIFIYMPSSEKLIYKIAKDKIFIFTDGWIEIKPIYDFEIKNLEELYGRN